MNLHTPERGEPRVMLAYLAAAATAVVALFGSLAALLPPWA